MDILGLLGVLAIVLGIIGLAGLIATPVLAEILLIAVGLFLVGAVGNHRLRR